MTLFLIIHGDDTYVLMREFRSHTLCIKTFMTKCERMVTQVKGEGKEVPLKRGDHSEISSIIFETFL
jgi:hypothetical protein